MQILLTGGSACGKSAYAETLAVAFQGPRIYIAAMRPFDDECLRKIERHRALRKGKGFFTLERYTDLSSLQLPERGAALLECLGNLTANELFGGAGENTENAVVEGVRNLAKQCERLIIVTNDVSSDGGQYSQSTLQYMETLNRINRRVAEDSDHVMELVCGIPIPWKGALI